MHRNVALNAQILIKRDNSTRFSISGILPFQLNYFGIYCRIHGVSQIYKTFLGDLYFVGSDSPGFGPMGLWLWKVSDPSGSDTMGIRLRGIWFLGISADPKGSDTLRNQILRNLRPFLVIGKEQLSAVYQTTGKLNPRYIRLLGSGSVG
jgi:hypothetical protein